MLGPTPSSARSATPSADEAARITGVDVRSLDDARRAADQIVAMGPGAALIKGGHLDAEGTRPLRILWERPLPCRGFTLC